MTGRQTVDQIRPATTPSNAGMSSDRPRRASGLALRLILLVVVAMLVLVTSIAWRLRAQAVSTTPPPAASTAPGPVAGERYRWRAVAIGGGGYITGLAFDASGSTVLARSDVYGAYRWNFGLDRWTPLVTAASMPSVMRVQNGMSGGVYEIAVAPSDGRRLFLAAKGRVFRSDDGGAHFVVASPHPVFGWDANSEFRFAGPFLAVDPDDRDRVLLGTPGDGLWRSDDAGERWTRVASVPPAADLRPAVAGVQAPGIAIWFEPGSRRLFAASPGHGLYIAAGSAAPFVRAPAGGPTTIARAVFGPGHGFYAIDREAQTAWVLHDDRWRTLTAPGALHAAVYAGIAADPHDGRVIVTDQGGEAWCSTDGGTQWVGVAHSQTAGAHDPPWLATNNHRFFAAGQISFDPGNDKRLWTAAGVGPYVAELDPGCTAPIAWQSRARGIEELVAEDVIQPPGHAPLFAALDFGIHLKRDLDAWSTGYGPKQRALIAAQDLDWTPADPDFVVTNASDTRMDCCSDDGDAVLAGYSSDAGVHWAKFPTLPTPPGTAATDPWRMAYGTIAVAADSRDNIVWEPAFDRSPFVTRDRGVSWQRVVFAGETLPNTGSFGSRWLPRRTLAADRVLPGTFYLVHSGGGANAALAGLWRTHDGGTRWSRAFRGEIAPGSGFAAKLRAVPGHAGQLFFSSANDAVSDTALRRSRDGGASWHIVAGVAHVDDIGFGKPAPHAAMPAIYISGQVGGVYGIWRSVDDAGHWQRIADLPLGRLDQVNVVEGDKNVFGRVYVGYTGSGWLYGEPAWCRPVAAHAVDASQCVAL